MNEKETVTKRKPREKKPKNPHADFKKLKLLITVVPRSKTEFYTDFISGFEVNFQTSVLGQGTARSNTLHLLGLDDVEKGVILSVVREDKCAEIFRALDSKFQTLRGGKGIAFTIPLASVIGAQTYRFLSNRT